MGELETQTDGEENIFFFQSPQKLCSAQQKHGVNLRGAAQILHPGTRNF